MQALRVSASMSLQTFEWDESSRLAPVPDDPTRVGRTYYRAFMLQDRRYQIGDSVYLHPEHDGMPPHLGKLQAAFTDNSPGALDVLCIEVASLSLLLPLRPLVLPPAVLKLTDLHCCRMRALRALGAMV